MLVRMTPEDGDILVRQAMLEGRVVYAISTVPGADQYLLPTREEAVAHASTFARRQRVRAWLSHERDGCVLLEDFRVFKSI
jgi:hypothetical protein